MNTIRGIFKQLVLGLDRILENIDRRLPRRLKISLLIILFVSVGLFLAAYIRNHDVAVLNPQGLIAHKQRNLLIFAALLSLIVVIPVFIMTFVFAYKYRETNHKARYTPDHDHSLAAETVWWGVPLILITILSVVTWNSSHALDHFKPLDTTTKPLTVQVVALQWKWLFIYPEQRIATVNYLQIPEQTAINFEITSDAPMNSLWIPQLGGQVYAMSGMSTKLHLMADQTGSYEGLSANISGEGFADMRFKVDSVSQTDFEQWVGQQQQSTAQLDRTSYQSLAEPSLNHPVSIYQLSESTLYNDIVMKFSAPHHGGQPSTSHNHGHLDYKKLEAQQ